MSPNDPRPELDDAFSALGDPTRRAILERLAQGDAGLDISREPVDFSIVRPGETVLPEGEPETLF